jgi:hypothetical protein
MVQSAKIAVLNSLLFVRDSKIRHVPKIDGDSAVWSTASCVAVSCLPDCDGDTEVTLGVPQELGVNKAPLFDGRLITPSRRLIVETVLGQTILEASVPNPVTRVKIWTNGFRDSDKIVVGVD